MPVLPNQTFKKCLALWKKENPIETILKLPNKSEENEIQ